MSSPADGLQCPQADFLARWMPSSTRAGVILHPSPDLAGAFRHISAVDSPSLQPDDSFTSDFAPLPASTDSSCIGVDGVQRAGSGVAVNGLSPAPTGFANGKLNPLDGMTTESQDLPLMMKLEQLRKWQQHMQEQLKAHQLEELLHLQEEQQRLLGHMNGSQHCKEQAGSSGMSEAEWDNDSLHGAPQYRPSGTCSGVPQSSTSGFQHIEGLSSTDRNKGQLFNVQGDKLEDSMEDSNDDTDYCSGLDDTLTQSNNVVTTKDKNRKVNDVFPDRPIKPGIGGQKQTFEELLEEQLRLEEQRLQVVHQQQIPDEAKATDVIPKRAYLKRGEGLARFAKNRQGSVQKLEIKKDAKPQPQARVISRRNSEPVSVLKVSGNTNHRLPVQRKTAVLNKENCLRGIGVALQDSRAESRPARTKVLGNRQQQNTDGPCSQTDTERRRVKHQLGQRKEQSNRSVDPSLQATRNSVQVQPNPVTKQVVVLGGPGQPDNNPAKTKSCGSRTESSGGRSNSGAEVGAPQDSFEVSFQEKLQRWECDRQLERMELGEFELLEQAAEELSFSSNSSFVMKVLQMDQQHQHTVNGRHQRRLSSTPIKTEPRVAPQRCSSVGNTDGLSGQSSSVNSEAFKVQVRAETLNTKTNSERKLGADGETEEKRETSEASSCSGSEFEDEEIAAKSALGFQAPSNPPYDKRSYQDEDTFEDSASDVEQEDDGESDSVLSNAEDSTLIEERDSKRGKVVFDDDDTWNDLEASAAGMDTNSKESSPAPKLAADPVLPSREKMLRKLAGCRAVQPEEEPVAPPVTLEPDPPPASQLMTRLFPSLKPKSQNTPISHPPAVTVARNPPAETGQQVQSRQLRERLVELEIEIERFKKENAALAKLRQENEKTQENLRKERLDFETTKAEELAKFEEYKKEENKKLQKERKLFETHVLAARALPDKKEREEIQALKQQLNSLQEELKRRESRWTATHSRQRQQIDSLSQDNGSLREEICMLEKLRLSTWKKSPVAAEKEPETRDSPRVCENNTPSVTKGVTFASPLASRGSSSSPPRSSTAARRPSKELSQTAAAGMKSSLRKPAGTSGSSSSSSSSVPSSRTEERSAVPCSKSQEKLPTQQQHHSSSPKRDSPVKEAERTEAGELESASEVITHQDGKVEKVLATGDRHIIFPNGTRKEVSADGHSVKVTFFNGDTKRVTADQRVIYYYADAKTTHITYPDGMEVLHFPNNQTEKHFPGGRKEITFPDQTVKNLFPDGREESVLTDGTIIQVNADGTKEIHFNTGQKEIHTTDYKRREYPDGTVKTVYTDGRQETRYPTGRVRVKDKDGNVILDHMA